MRDRGWPATLNGRPACYRTDRRVQRSIPLIVALVGLLLVPSAPGGASPPRTSDQHTTNPAAGSGGSEPAGSSVSARPGPADPAGTANLPGADPSGRASPEAAISIQITATPRRGHIPLPVNFTATSRGSTRALEYNFTWQFGDGTPTFSESKNVSPGAAGQSFANHTYGQVGTFVANVTITDGVDPTASAPITITSTLPLVATAVALPPALTLGRPLLLAGTATGGSPPYTFIWSGVPSGCGVSGQNLSCVPKVVGPYNVRLQVSDVIPNYASTFVNFTINSKLTASATYTSWYHCVGNIDFLTDNFSGVARGGTPPYAYSWNPDDGSANLSGANVTHNFTSRNLFNVTLAIVDASGATANRTLTISTSFVACGGLPSFNPLVTPALVGGVIVAAAAVAVLAIILFRGLRPKGPAPLAPSPSAVSGGTTPPTKEVGPGGQPPSIPPGAEGPAATSD